MYGASAMAGDSIISHLSMEMNALSHFINAFINVKCADTVSIIKRSFNTRSKAYHSLFSFTPNNRESIERTNADILSIWHWGTNSGKFKSTHNSFHSRKCIWICHDDVIKWKHFPRYCPSPHKGQWRGALMFYLICVWINIWVDNREAGDLRRYSAHYDVTVMSSAKSWSYCSIINILVSKLDRRGSYIDRYHTTI